MRGNQSKIIEKHGVTNEQVESSFRDPELLALGIQVHPYVDEDRYAIIANTKKSELIFVCFAIRSGCIRPISARKENNKEREIYEKKIY